MQTIKGILFEPVGCLAEFAPEPFLEIAAQLSGRPKKTSKSGSRSYWHLLNVMKPATHTAAIEALELEAVEQSNRYDDVIPALSELTAMGIQLVIASSLSNIAIARFLEKNSLREHFFPVCTRDTAKGIKAAPLQSALIAACLQPSQAMFLTDTAEGLKVAQSAGVHAILMMNDPDESRRLAMQKPAGGIVSLHELPDFIRFLRAEHLRTKTSSPIE